MRAVQRSCKVAHKPSLAWATRTRSFALSAKRPAAKKIGKGFGVMPRIYEDACVRKPNIFIWIICSRDLSKVAPEDLKRIVAGREQRKYDATRPYSSDGECLTVIDSFLDKLHAIRPFTLLKQDIQTNGDFRSTYHFRICDFAS